MPESHPGPTLEQLPFHLRVRQSRAEGRDQVRQVPPEKPGPIPHLLVVDFCNSMKCSVLESELPARTRFFPGGIARASRSVAGLVRPPFVEEGLCYQEQESGGWQ